MALYAALIVLLHLPPVQVFLGSEVSQILGQKLGTRVSVGKVNLGLLNRAILDNVTILDQKGDSMLCVARMSAKVDIIPLTEGKISVSAAQIFGLRAKLYKQDAHSRPNYQFVVDSLASKDTTEHKPLDLHIGSLIVRHGAVSYDRCDTAPTPGRFSAAHIAVTNLSMHVFLGHLTDNNIDLLLKKLSFNEGSGLHVNSLHFRLIADRQKAKLQEFELQLPHSDITLGDITANYRQKGDGSLDMATLQYGGSIRQSKVTLADIASLVPQLKAFDDAIFMNARFSGTSTSLRCPSVNFRTGSGSINLQARSKVADLDRKPRWNAAIDNLNLSADGIALIADKLGHRITIPKEVLRLGTIHYNGTVGGTAAEHIHSDGQIQTDAGNANVTLAKTGNRIQAHVDTRGIDMGRILDNDRLGILATTIDVAGTSDNLYAKGNVDRLDFGGYSFRGISLDASLVGGLLKGTTSIDDNKARLSLHGDYHLNTHKFAIDGEVTHLVPAVLGVKTHDADFSLDHVTVSANNKGRDSYLDVEAPFANLHARGEYDLTTIWKGIGAILAEKLPTLPGLPRPDKATHNDFTIQANVRSTEPLRRMLGIPLDISAPIHINGNVNDQSREINLYLSAPAFSYDGTPFHGANIEVNTIHEALVVDARIAQGMTYETAPTYRVRATAADNQLATLIDYDNHSTHLPVKGRLDATTRFSRSQTGLVLAHVNVNPSEVMLGETRWDVHPSEVEYYGNNLAIDNFAVSHGKQHIIVNGKATNSPTDSIVADLNDVDVAYILNLVNFHSVDFTGRASGKAVAKSIFHDPDAYAHLDVADFTFENGPLGILHAAVNFNKQESQIDIHAIADDGPGHQTLIDGYVSPKRNYIDLGIEAQGTSLKFMENFCGSFMEDVKAWADGKMRIVGDLSNINLVGDVVAHGGMHMTQLGTDYTFDRLRAHAVPDDIQLLGDTIHDRRHNAAVIKGGIHHRHLTSLSFDLDVKARNFLGFDTREFGDNTFYGTVYATGNVGIHGKSGETVIDIDASPEPGSVFVYNVASPDAISDKSFIHWHDVTPHWQDAYTKTEDKEEEDDDDIPSDMRINFLINANRNLTVKLIMDPQSGDYIDLMGDGVIRANYFNKGGFDMFGNYVVNHGVYKLTIQNIIKKDFEFLSGGTIAFGGNPYSAPLNLQAKYTVNGVPLSDLNIGRSFSSNNTRVECLMNISGTPSAPAVDFTMNLPTVNSDAKQMIYSLINSQEEMNQQVLYLLAVGRFMPQTKNNQASESQQSQTSLAMQSILSGTISQQLNNVLSGLVNNNNWNFGANISTGDEGFNNAEYEGILSGKMLGNRLLFNGQFGYRDKANATQSFIGDFDLRYLIYPNGNLAVRMYNQTNDRYFTRNSLNTQGIGLIMKKDFSSLGDLFGIKRKKKKNK